MPEHTGTLGYLAPINPRKPHFTVVLPNEFQQSPNKMQQQRFSSVITWVFAWIVVGSLSLEGKAQADESSAVFANDKMINVEIKLDANHWYELRTGYRTVGEGMSQITEKPYDYYQANVSINGQTMEKVGVRKKGFFGSVVSTRPSLKLRFDKFVKNRTFLGLEMMTLNNNVQDFSQVHQVMAYEFFDRAGIPTPRCNLARVSVNGEELGIYSHIESIRTPFIKRHFSNSKGYLYEGYAGDFNDDDFSRIVLKSGNEEKATVKLKQLRETINQGDRINVSDLEGILNLEAFIQLWAAEVLIGHWDGYSGNRNNYYLYFDKQRDLFYFIPWGADAVFRDPGPFVSQPVPKSIKAMGFLCKRLWEVPAIRDRYRAEMQRLLDEVWNEDKMTESVINAQAMVAAHLTIPSIQVAQSTQMIHTFIKTRRTDIQKELDQAPLDWPEVAPMGPSNQEDFIPMQLTGSFSTVFGNSDPSKVLEQGEAELDVTIGGETQPPFTRIGAIAFTENQNFMVPRPMYP
ncbi:CotH kinase family protein, partial [Verrucomicrobia bacterium]|nr:CotH kinase family protein [Verrucomicrobiota bacterium]